jgi:hypothetical protein
VCLFVNMYMQARGGGVPVDEGLYYASKDFWDPVKKRRILWCDGNAFSFVVFAIFLENGSFVKTGLGQT